MAGWLPQELIRRKRDGEALTAADLAMLAGAMADGSLPDAQAAAFAMAVYFRGMEPAECAALTFAMRDTGEVLHWRELGVEGPVLDKHSTGGVGDLVSLVLGPMLAACGASVPMISGRGLGHTGGTLDKLEAIPGYQALPPREQFVRVVREVGVAIVGADRKLAPADRRLYALRDVTATVDSIPLITASILSKKLAAGTGALVLDVKTGNGAVMREPAQATALAVSLVQTAGLAGLPARALLTDMSEPLAHSAGNALEVREAIAMLKGEVANARLLEVTLALGAEALVLGGLADDADAARRALQQSLASGAAAERFGRMVSGLGGPADLLERPAAHLAAAPVIVEVPAQGDGYISLMDTRALGLAVVGLGGGRTVPGQPVDARVGLDRILGLGTAVKKGDPLARIHAADEAAAADAVSAVSAAIQIAAEPFELAPLVRHLDAASGPG